MVNVRTSSGFEAEINENLFDDMEVLDLISDLEEGKVTAYRKLLSKILTDEDKGRMYDHLRTDDGRVPVSAVSAEVTDIFRKVEEAKKS